MLDRALLTLPLTGGRPIDSYDPRFAELADGVLRGRYIAAAEGAARLLAERHYDVRLVSYFVFGVVVEQGVEGLGWAMELLSALGASGWAGLGPAQSQQRHVKASLRWLFEAISRRLTHLDDDPAGRARFMEAWDDARRAALIEASERVADQLEGVGDLGLAARKVVSALRTLAVAPPPPLVEPTPPAATPAQAPAEEVEEEAAEEEDAADEGSEASFDEDSEASFDEDSEASFDEGSEGAYDEDTYDEGSERTDDEDSYDEGSERTDDEDPIDAPEDDRGSPRRPRAAPRRATGPPVSAPPPQAAPAWDELLARLAMFERLIADGANTQAAVVADDIEARLNHFDPRRYFPAVFVGYYAALADNLPELEAAWEDRDTSRWRVLRQLYELDPERFRRAR